MAPRRMTVFLASLVLLSGLSVAAGAVIDAPPILTVENEDDTTYRVTAYTVEDRQTALLTNFAITTEDGERRLATLSQLIWPEGYQNVSVADDGIPTQQVTVEPGRFEDSSSGGDHHGNRSVWRV